MEEALVSVITKAIDARVFPGCCLGIVKNGQMAVYPFGKITYEYDAPSVTSETIYDVASITKAIPTALLALCFIDQKKLSLTDQVISYIPELRTRFRDQLTIWHLLTYTLEFPFSLSSFKELPSDEILEHIYQAELVSPPGSKFVYTNATSILLGILLERCSGKKLHQLADAMLFQSLGMKRTTFFPERFLKEDIVPSEIDTWRGEVRGIVHDESAYALRPGAVGSAGLFSTAADLLTVLTMLLNNGKVREKTFLSEEMLTEMTRNQIKRLDASTGLGWELDQPRFMGKHASEHTFGKTGFTGCMIAGDIMKQQGFVLLSNYHYPRRKDSTESLDRVRQAVADSVFGEVRLRS